MADPTITDGHAADALPSAPVVDIAPPTRGPGGLPEGRRRVLYAVRRRGEATAEQVAEQLAMTVSGARQHLSALVEDGLLVATPIAATAVRPGRRSLSYSVSSSGDAHFPKAYGELTNELLGYLAAEEPEALERLFAKRREARIAGARDRLGRHASLEDQVAELSRILDEDGYLASWEPTGDGGYRVVEHNCAIWAVASRYGQACTSELDFIRAVLPTATVERVQHMVEGARRCAYEVRPTA
jgi:DeoR family transcriptional regulator, suf operon transcriptional repressor